MKIAEIRRVIESANWCRADSTGGTREENRKCDLPRQLLPHVARLDALEIPAGGSTMSIPKLIRLGEEEVARVRDLARLVIELDSDRERCDRANGVYPRTPEQRLSPTEFIILDNARAVLAILRDKGAA